MNGWGFVLSGMMHAQNARAAEQGNAKAVSTATGSRGDGSAIEEEPEMVDDFKAAWALAEKQANLTPAVSNL